MDVLVSAAIIGIAVFVWLYRHLFSNPYVVEQDPLKGRPLNFGRVYYRMPDGSIRSRKREFRRVLMESKGKTSGRQWVRIRKAIPKALRPFV